MWKDAVVFLYVERYQTADSGDAVERVKEEPVVFQGTPPGFDHRVREPQRRLAALGERLGRRVLAQVATTVTPDTILGWHHQLIVQKWKPAFRTAQCAPGDPPARRADGD